MAEFTSAITLLFRDLFTPKLTEAVRSLNRSSAVIDEMRRATDRTGGALAEFRRDADRAGGAVAELGRDADRAGGAVAELGRDAANRTGGAVAELARDADRAGGAVAELGRDADRAGGELAAMGRDADRAGRETRRSTGLMQGAWKGLDILDDIGGVIGMIDGLTAGLREMASEAIEASRETELALARVASLQTEYEGGAGGHLAIRERETLERQAYLFATRQSAIGELVSIAQAEYIARTKEAISAGLGLDAAMALTEHSALLGVAAEGTTTEAAEMLRPLYNLMADHEADPVSEISRLTDQVAATQAFYDLPALADLTEAVSAAATLSDQQGLPTEVMLAAIGAFHQGKITGSEAGEGLKSALEEIVGGMERLGSSVVVTADGNLDLPGTLRVLRDMDLGNPVERSEAMKVFGEEGSQALTLLSGKMYAKFIAGIEEARDSEGRTIERSLPVVETRHMRRERLSVAKGALRQESPWGRFWATMDLEFLSFMESVQESRIESLESARQLSGIGAWLEARFGGGSYRAIIPETLAEGMPAGADALGAATEATLQTGVGDYLPHSDARRGPLSHLTAAGRAIPITLAEGVLQEAGLLPAAVTASLALPAAALDGDPDAGLSPPRARDVGAPGGPALHLPPELLAALLDLAAELRATRDVATELRALRNDLRTERRPAPAETRVVVDGDLANADAAEYLAGLGDDGA